MLRTKKIPVIDLFAGPGGLSEGFSLVKCNASMSFHIALSIEKEKNAYKTLELRSFFRQFKKDKVPDEYYKVLRENDPSKKGSLIKELYSKFSIEYQKANNEVWLAELGSKKFPPQQVDKKIKNAIGKAKNWLLIGGPPCQAYSLVGRSRVGGIDEKDERVNLYREYLRIIASFNPAVFVMENVKGLLSAEVNNERIFKRILRDLKDPSSVFNIYKSKKYKIYSFTTNTIDHNNPSYSTDRDYLIESEKYGIPQKRHRVILLGIREDINVSPETLTPSEKKIKLRDVIGDLPKIRSGINRSYLYSKIIKEKKKRFYKIEKDNNYNWETVINNYLKDINSWNVFNGNNLIKNIKSPIYGVGSEFIKCKTPSDKNPLRDWYKDEKLNGICNHESRKHMIQDLKRYLFCSMFSKSFKRFPLLNEYELHSNELLPDHKSADSGKFPDRFRVQLPNEPATTITSHISKDGHYFIHYDTKQCRSFTVREAARVQTFPDNYLFCGSRTSQYNQVGNAVPPYLAKQIGEIVLNIFLRID